MIWGLAGREDGEGCMFSAVSEQEETERTECEALLCFLCFLLFKIAYFF
jgi:hypothetical protein